MMHGQKNIKSPWFASIAVTEALYLSKLYQNAHAHSLNNHKFTKSSWRIFWSRSSVISRPTNGMLLTPSFNNECVVGDTNTSQLPAVSRPELGSCLVNVTPNFQHRLGSSEYENLRVSTLPEYVFTPGQLRSTKASTARYSQ